MKEFMTNHTKKTRKVHHIYHVWLVIRQHVLMLAYASHVCLKQNLKKHKQPGEKKCSKVFSILNLTKH